MEIKKYDVSKNGYKGAVVEAAKASELGADVLGEGRAVSSQVSWLLTVVAAFVSVTGDDRHVRDWLSSALPSILKLVS